MHQAAGETRSRAARGQVWSLMKMIAECRDDEIRADARGGDKDEALENTSFDSGWRMKREGFGIEPLSRYERHTGTDKDLEGTKTGGDHAGLGIWINDFRESRFNKGLRMVAAMRQQ